MDQENRQCTVLSLSLSHFPLMEWSQWRKVIQIRGNRLFTIFFFFFLFLSPIHKCAFWETGAAAVATAKIKLGSIFWCIPSLYCCCWSLLQQQQQQRSIDHHHLFCQFFCHCHCHCHCHFCQYLTSFWLLSRHHHHFASFLFYFKVVRQFLLIHLAFIFLI